METRLPLNASLPKGLARRALQQKGQFWTPDWVAEAMVACVLSVGPEVVFDPAVGAGAFFTACRRLGYTGRFAGCENDLSALKQARSAGLSEYDLRKVHIQDFFEAEKQQYPAIVSNPPYIRHHRIDADLKAHLQKHARAAFGISIDGRAGLHVHFLLHCLERLAPGGRLAFLLPADTFEGVFASTLWNWITSHFRLRAVVTFAPAAAPFPAVDTNVLIVTVENAVPHDTFIWARMLAVDGAVLRNLLCENNTSHSTIEVCHRHLDEALGTGLTRPPRSREHDEMYLGDVARVMRGIATGANDFFFLNSRQIDDYQLDRAYFVRAIGRTRDCPEETLEVEQLEYLDREGRPTWLLDLPDRPVETFPLTVQRYLAEGEARGLSERPLIRMRKRWYRGEQRAIPLLLFAYLGRRSCRFVLNRAKVLPLTGFLCVYPRPEVGIDTESLWRLLNDSRTLEQLTYVGKSYGSGAVKVEPRALERLVLPAAVCNAAGLKRPTVERQMALMETPGEYISSKSGSKYSKGMK